MRGTSKYALGAIAAAVLWAFSAHAAPSFQLLSPPSAPSARAFMGTAQATVSGDGRTYVFGGRLNNGNESSETWRYSSASNTWTNLPSNPQGARARGALAFDPQSRKVVAFGGGQLVNILFIGLVFTSHHDLAFLNPDTETWSTPAVSGSPPSDRSDSGLVWADGQSAFFLFGGAQYGLLGITTRFNDLYRLNISGNTASWTGLSPQGSVPSPRAGSCVAYDRPRDLILVFGGATGGGEVNDLYRYDPSANRWDVIATSGTPSQRAWPSCAYDAEADKLLVFGGAQGSSLRTDAFALDLSTWAWSPVTPPSSPSARYGAPMAFSDQLHASILFGGQTSGSASSELWKMALASPPIVSAGSDRLVDEGVSASLLGWVTTDPPGLPVTLHWTQLSGPAVTLSDPAAAQPTFQTPPVTSATQLRFRLSATQGSFVVTSDVTLTVQDTVNEPPVAVPRALSSLPGRLTLDGTDSHDDNGEPLTFFWMQISGPPLPLDGPTQPQAQLTLPMMAETVTLQFELTVEDPRGGMGTGLLNIEVPASGGPPRADSIEVFIGPPSNAIPGEQQRPKFTSVPRRVAPLGETFQYTTTALGTPPLQLTLVSGPEGAMFNPDTGDIKWTPQAEGAAHFVLNAENAFGEDEQSFIVQALSPVSLNPAPLQYQLGCSAVGMSGAGMSLHLLGLLGLWAVRRRTRHC